MDFSIRHQALSNGIFVVTPEGSIDSFSSEAFAKALQVIFKPGTKALLLDMAKVKYISSVGLGVLISAMKKSKDENSGFWVYDTQLSVKRVLEISKLDFLELTLNTLDSQSPYMEYITSEEPQRQKRREAEESQKKKRDAEIAERNKKEKSVN